MSHNATLLFASSTPSHSSFKVPAVLYRVNAVKVVWLHNYSYDKYIHLIPSKVH